MQTTIDSQSPQPDPFPALQEAVLTSFARKTAGAKHLFQVQVNVDLFDLFLSKLPSAIRQHHTCNACRSFVRRYGRLVRIDEEGHALPVMWSIKDVGDDSPFLDAVREIFKVVQHGRVSEPFFTTETTWGQPLTGDWTHLYVQPAEQFVTQKSTIKTPSQLAAECVEELKMLQAGLAEYPVAAVRKAVSYLQNSELQRGEKHLDLAQWLVRLHELPAATGEQRRNLLWRAVAAAPAGWCHVKSGMIGTLLDDIVAGLPFEQVKRRYNEKMHPLQYQRPTAPPAAGNIDQAEKIVDQLGVKRSLERRFAKLSDLKILWAPQPPKAPAPAKPGTFAHLRTPKASAPVLSDAPAQTITWEKFARTVLPGAERIELLVQAGRQPFAAYVTAVHADAPPILQWESPVSWYFKHPGSAAEGWNLRSGQFVEVTAVSLLPTMWQDPPVAHQGLGALFVLRGARDVEYRPGNGGGFFVESLRSEFHAIRKTLEAHVTQALIQGAEEAEACGICLKSNSGWGSGQVLRVTAAGVQTLYRLDRWD